MNRRRWQLQIAGCAIVFSTIVSIAASSVQPVIPLASPSSTSARVFVDQYCVGCHNDKRKTAGLELKGADVEHAGENPELWEKIVRKLRVGDMPPSRLPRPDAKAYDGMVSYLEGLLDRASGANPNPGRPETFHRLNRTEYRNAIRDLLALDIDADSLLPMDDASYGFDNVNPGGISPALLERYLSAAQKISRIAIGSSIHSPAADVFVVPADLTQEDHLEGLPFGTRGGTMVHYNFPQNGDYEIQLRLTRDRNEEVEGLFEAHQLEVTMDGERLQLFTVMPPPPESGQGAAVPEEADAGLHFRAKVQAGPHDVAAAFLKNSSALLETERQPYQAHINLDRSPRTQPALYSLSIAGPFNASGVGDTPSRRRIFVCYPGKPTDGEACATTILSKLLRRAYRRPVTTSGLQAAMTFYKNAQLSEGFEAGIEMALRSILANPEFLFRIENDPAGIEPNTIYQISDTDIASRLSFFLWSSIPDEELLDLAARRRLHEPVILEQQVKRMLANPRSQALTTNFGAQWLDLRNLAVSAPDPRIFPDFDDNLRQAFRRETELFFESVVKENRSVLDLLSANYTFLNERLAKHYGIANVYGSRFRRVILDSNSPRRGLLGQGSILTVTSYGNRTSPVLRGKWVLENLFGLVVPPPPAKVPTLPDSSAGAKVPSIGERLTQHRTNPACASCHQVMDPIGLAMENFDAVGRWRSRAVDGTPIDVAGTLPDGTTFVGADGLRQALLKRQELFVSTMTEKLLTYALGRGLEYYDAPAVRTIVRSARDHEYRFSSIIAGIVRSTPFVMRRSS